MILSPKIKPPGNPPDEAVTVPVLSLIILPIIFICLVLVNNRIPLPALPLILFPKTTLLTDWNKLI